eukprot:ANDGO_07252.mRNA.1 hypothetical protein
MLMPYVGTVDEYWTALNSQTGASEQCAKRVVAVAQASSSEKTRLSYTLGQKNALVIVIRIPMQLSEELASPLEQWQRHVEEAHRIDRGNHPRHVASFAMTCLRLLVATHAEWVAEVLTALSERQCGAEIFREAALRWVRNGS